MTLEPLDATVIATMTLVINCIVNPDERRRFDELVLPRLQRLTPDPFVLRHLESPESLADGDDHPRLLLSGSELSAAQQNPRDDELCDLIRSFVDAGKPVFGICYGEQMLARAVGGRCRRAAVPEFGWKRVAIRPNPLFQGLDELIPVHSHYDEVYDLPPSCERIAWTDDCAVQAFQLRDRPVWGVQFHPEMSYDEGSRMMRGNLRTEPLAPRHYVDELKDPARVDDNLKLFENFFAAEPVAVGAREAAAVAAG
ncbi:MAG: gamma-glutamyl-gamma-aminobutyrate hydrolase family protein [Acidobacteriota bacterium]